MNEKKRNLYSLLEKNRNELSVVESELHLLCSRRSRLVEIAMERTARLNRRHFILFAERRWTGIESLYRKAYKHNDAILELSERQWAIKKDIEFLQGKYSQA